MEDKKGKRQKAAYSVERLVDSKTRQKTENGKAQRRISQLWCSQQSFSSIRASHQIFFIKKL